MARCCICGKEAAFLVNGMWWCEEHRKLINESSEKKTAPKTRKSTQPSTDLGLKWV